MDAVCAFFQAAMKANADRVLGPEHPMTYQEVATLFSSMDWGVNVKCGAKDHGSANHK